MKNTNNITHKSDIPIRILRPSDAKSINLSRLWEYRELLVFLTLRDISVRYKQTVIGIAWAIIQPLLQMVIFTIIFGLFAGIPTGGDEPYAIFSFAALVPYNFFAWGVERSSNSIVSNGNMVSKIYFPRIILPISGVFAAMVDFLMAFAILIAMMLFYGYSITWRLLAVFPLLGLAIMTSLGIGLFLSALNVRFRDIRFLLPFIIQMMQYLAPIVYPLKIVPEQYQIFLLLNPMTIVIEGFRWMIIGSNDLPEWNMILLSVGMSFALLASGIIYFKRMESVFADFV